ncbi:DUF317 domain-containing protein [Streptomyces scopuliridis]|uniref:DUF317 domain-containing protein n=1 Tax=Streptomyces scopuliridis TaxID=452529 RepID=A0ACD4ZUA8_9ACTN|nr:DUF317 domain-containing protein [Streptomyces scopuliridis]WSC01539.1 DUF317 domain-containing protein [Streptomyces scopuliridis]WSC04923.1 DUF317 domain-containing protein [Streptomyces scopuliridis]
MNAFEPTDRVLVSPRYLAGAGAGRLGDALGALIHLFGWHTTHDPATGHISLDSPHHSLSVDFDPSRFDGIWWTIAHHEPFWKAQFTHQTPIEAIAAVTQALPQLLGDHRHAERIPLTTTSPSATAATHRWTAESDGTVFTSPDGHCTLRCTPDDEAAWTVSHSVYGRISTEWSAVFTRDAPERLFAQFFAHLASNDPVERVFNDVPRRVQHSESALITPVRGAAVNPHTHHAVAQAARAHADRHPRR